MTFDIYICYSIEDLEIAEAISIFLEENNYRCLMGKSESHESIDEILNSQMLFFISSQNSIKACNEVKDAFLNNIPILVFQLDDSLEDNESLISQFLDNQVSVSADDDEFLNKILDYASKTITSPNEDSGENNSFKYLESLIGTSNEVILDCDIVLDGTETDSFKDGIKIGSDNVVIDGNGHTIDGKSKSRIFDVKGKKIVFRDIVFVNGKNFMGGAINIQDNSDVCFINCEFKNNNALQNGGAIFQNGGILRIIASEFLDNASQGMGGAINTENGALTINGCLISNSNARFGGALRMNHSKLFIENSKLDDNSSKYGGAINYNESDLEISHCSFSNNSANVNGGAIETQNGTLNIQDTEFLNNSAKYGSAIRNHSLALIKDCKFINEGSDEGVLFNKKGSLEVSNCKFKKIKSKNHLIYNEDYLAVNGSDFKDNNASNIILNLSNSNLSDCKFLKNVCGHVFKNQGKSSNLIRCHFKDNESEIDVLNESDLTVEKLFGESKFILNKKNIFIKQLDEDKIENLGNIEYLTRLHEDFDFTYLDGLISSAKSKEIILNHDIAFKNYERDFYEGGIVIDIDGIVIDGANHTIDGGEISRIFTITSRNVTLKNIFFKKGYSHKNNYENPLNNNGGAIRINSKGNLECIGCEFISNFSEDKGGAIDNRGGNLKFTDCRFISNSSEFVAGAIINRKYGKTELKDCILNQNKTNFNGGAIENEGNISLEGCSLSSNASKYGGAIRNVNVLDAINCIFKDNEASDGGAVNNHKNGDAKIKNSLFKSNIADSGGALENRGLSLMLVEDTFVKNSSKGDGGALYSYFGEAEVKDCIFKDNDARGVGGAIWNFNSNSNLKIINPTFGKNCPDNVFKRL